jgi:hypothetical protein
LANRGPEKVAALLALIVPTVLNVTEEITNPLISTRAAEP